MKSKVWYVLLTLLALTLAATAQHAWPWSIQP